MQIIFLFFPRKKNISSKYFQQKLKVCAKIFFLICYMSWNKWFFWNLVTFSSNKFSKWKNSVKLQLALDLIANKNFWSTFESKVELHVSFILPVVSELFYYRSYNTRIISSTVCADLQFSREFSCCWYMSLV